MKTYTNTLQRTRNKQYDKRIRKKTSVSTTHYVQKQETLLHYCSSDNYLEWEYIVKYALIGSSPKNQTEM